MPKVVKKPQAAAELESAVIHCVQARGQVSRVDVARRLKLVPSTAGIYVGVAALASLVLVTRRDVTA